MVKVKRANVILTIEEDQIDKYIEKGYSVLDQNGNVVKAGAPKDVGALQALLQEKDVEIANLKKEIERLKAIQESSETEFKPEKRSYKKRTQEIQEQ